MDYHSPVKVTIADLAKAHANTHLGLYEVSDNDRRSHLVLKMDGQKVRYLDIYTLENGKEAIVHRSVTSRIQWDLDLQAGRILFKYGPKPGKKG